MSRQKIQQDIESFSGTIYCGVLVLVLMDNTKKTWVKSPYKIIAASLHNYPKKKFNW